MSTATSAGHGPQRLRDIGKKPFFCASVTLWLVVGMLSLAAPADAQIRGYADVGLRTFTATQTFGAIFGTSRGTVFGGGVDVSLPKGLFVGLRASRYRDTGERVFVFNGETFPLGIATTVTITPLELTGGYRYDRGQRLVPYAGAGLGWHTYDETSEFATDDENVSERFRGYHVLGGVEARLGRWLGVGGEAQWTTVPDALGQDANGVATEFDETNLGGATFRVKVVIGH